MADVIRSQIAGVVQRREAKPERAQLPVELGTAESVTVTVRKPGESSFSASAGSTVTQIAGKLYALNVHSGDSDRLGIIWFRLTGSTDTTYCCAMIVEYDPYSEGAVSDLMLKHRAASPA